MFSEDYGAGTWDLKFEVFYKDLKIKSKIRVRSDLTIGIVIMKLIDSLGKKLRNSVLHCFISSVPVINTLE